MGDTALVTGGAGYIRSHTVRQLVAPGYRVVVLDDPSTGLQWETKLRTDSSGHRKRVSG
jgi:UDP-glucose 4-epimerase